MSTRIPACIKGHEGLYEQNPSGVWRKNDISNSHLPSTVYKDGNQYWENANGIIHRDGDLPAAIYSSGSMAWWQNGKIHRDNDKPATIRADGTMFWYQNGKIHRDGGMPAVVYPNGLISFWEHGKFIARMIIKDNPVLHKLYGIKP